MRHARSAAIFVTLWLGSILISPGSPALARSSSQVPVGARALGMGGAFSSIADDGSALFWNPAGLPWVGHQEISATHADLFGTGIQDNLASYLLPLSPNSASAVDWYHSGYDDTELGFGDGRLDLAYGRRITSFLSAGGTVKYLSRDTELDGTSIRRGNGVGFDLGLIARPLDRVRLGIVGQDLFGTNVSYSDGMGTTEAFPMNVRAGASYAPRRDAVISFDADDRWHLGAEGRPLPMLALRAGLQNDWRPTDGVTWSIGAGVKTGIFRFDYALVDHPVLGSTSSFGLALEFNFNPSLIRIEKVEPKDLFASFYKTYAREPVAAVRVRNLDDHPIETKLRVLIPGVMRAPTEQVVVLRPKATEEVPVTAILPDEVTGSAGNRSVQMQVTATYQSARLPRTERGSAKAVLYAPGAIDWSRGTDQAAAYVTMADPAVDAFAREATRLASTAGDTPLIQRDIMFAAAIVDALASIGFTYVPDPDNPFSAISETPRAVDTIAYPSESLRRKTGDCDDSTVLLAALLGNVGIPTRFVDVPGHIFLMMDTGVHERNRVALGLEESRTVVADQRVWIPLETTSIQKGFAQAGEDGVDAFASWSSRGRATVVDVESALLRYEPSAPSRDAIAAPEVDASKLESRLAADIGTIAGWRQARLSRMLAPGGGADTSFPATDLQLAHVYYGSARWDEARQLLEKALLARVGDPGALNDLGNILAASGDLPAAAERYEEALKLGASDPGIWLNLGLVRYALGDTAEAQQPIAEGIERSGGYEKACALLALSPGTGDAREGRRRMTEEEARALLQDAMRRVPLPPAGASTERKTPDAGKTPVKAWRSRVAAGRSSQGMALQDHLYWKD